MEQNALDTIKSQERNSLPSENIFCQMLDLEIFKIAKFCTLVGHNNSYMTPLEAITHLFFTQFTFRSRTKSELLQKLNLIIVL